MRRNDKKPRDAVRETPGDNGTIRCAVYTRKSTDEGLDQEFNSLDAQRESAEATRDQLAKLEAEARKTIDKLKWERDSKDRELRHLIQKLNTGV